MDDKSAALCLVRDLLQAPAWDDERGLKYIYWRHLAICRHDFCLDCENAINELKNRDIAAEQSAARLACTNRDINGATRGAQ